MSDSDAKPDRPPAGSRIPLGARSGRINPVYGVIVQGLKIVLPTVAVGLIALIFLWPQIAEQTADLGMQFFGIDQSTSDAMQLSNARYQGVDAENQPFTVTADGVRQAQVDAEEVLLTKPKADIMLSDQSWAALTAENGRFNRETQQLTLTGDVSFFHDLGYEFRTNSATVDMAKGEAEGPDPVDGQGPFGQVEAEGFKVFDKGARILLTGKSKLLIYPEGDN